MPKDVVEFVVATGVSFGGQYMGKYTSVFKLIIPDRAWLVRKIAEGYTFTIVGRNLSWAMIEEIPTDQTKIAFAINTIDLGLFVTKDDRLISCTDSFVPKYLFMMGAADKVKEVNNIGYTPTTRTITAIRGKIRIRIICPTKSRYVIISMLLNSYLYSSVLFNGIDRTHATKYEIIYAHMVKGKRKVIGPIKDRGSSMTTLVDASKRLVSIRTNSSGCNISSCVSFNINKDNSVYTKWDKSWAEQVILHPIAYWMGT
ncbi:hypothetical protein LTR95_009942 [Oleoguttula sp. CCFEE 5521]